MPTPSRRSRATGRPSRTPRPRRQCFGAALARPTAQSGPRGLRRAPARGCRRSRTPWRPHPAPSAQICPPRRLSRRRATERPRREPVVKNKLLRYPSEANQ
eukprot:scaffold32388_cov31-Prasinocladus_malaysianus.AAC.3